MVILVLFVLLRRHAGDEINFDMRARTSSKFHLFRIKLIFYITKIRFVEVQSSAMIKKTVIGFINEQYVKNSS
jgi:hypothetical protein